MGLSDSDRMCPFEVMPHPAPAPESTTGVAAHAGHAGHAAMGTAVTTSPRDAELKIGEGIVVAGNRTRDQPRPRPNWTGESAVSFRVATRRRPAARVSHIAGVRPAPPRPDEDVVQSSGTGGH